MALTWRTGFEVELLAPPGRDRQVLAAEIARRHGGRVRAVFHLDSEPSLVRGMGHFWHLTQGFAVEDQAGAPLATLVDDVTINADLGAAHSGPSGAGWYRLLSDDLRLLRLVEMHSDAAAPFTQTLDCVADLFGTSVEAVGGARRLRDAAGETIALAAALPRGRERPCEIVTPPLVRDHEAALERLLAPARHLGFTIPTEAAVHLHLDGAPFRNVTAFANLVRLFGHWREALWAALGTNPACTRLQALPESLLKLVDEPWTGPDGTGDWAGLQAGAATTGLTKYFDVNLTALLVDTPPRDTVEVRILPGLRDAGEITVRAELVEALVERCRRERPVQPPVGGDPAGLVRQLHRLADEA